MFFYILLILCGAASLGSFLLNKYVYAKRSYSGNFKEAVGGWLIVAAVVFVGAIIIQAVFFQIIVNNNEAITCKQQQKEIYIEKRDVLQAKYGSLLDTNYQQHEIAIFESINKGKDASEINAVLYPQIKYAETLSRLTKEIDNLNSSIYHCDLLIADFKRSNRALYNSPFCIKLLQRR